MPCGELYAEPAMTTIPVDSEVRGDSSARWALATLSGAFVVFVVLTWAAGPLGMAAQDLCNTWIFSFGALGAVLAFRGGLSIVAGAIIAITLGPLGLRHIWTSAGLRLPRINR